MDRGIRADNSAAPWQRRPSTVLPLPLRSMLLGCVSLLPALLLAAPGFIPWAMPAAVAAVAAFGAPGFFLSQLLFKRGSLSVLARVPIAFVLSMAIAGAVGLVAFQLHLSPPTFYWALAALSALFGFAWVARAGGGKHEPSPTTWKRHEVALLVLMMVALFIAFRLELTSKQHVDDWTYLSYVQEYAGADRLAYVDPTSPDGAASDPRIWFNVWLLDQAFLGEVSGVHLVAMGRTYVPAILAVLALLATFALGREIIGHNAGGALAVLFQLTHFAFTAYKVNDPGHPFFNRIAEDKTLATVIILPVGLLFMLRYLRSGKRTYLLAHGLVAVALATTHPTISVFYAVAWGLFGAVHLLFERDRVAFSRLAALLVALLPCLLIPLVQKLASGEESAYISYNILDNVSAGLANRRLGRIISLSEDGSLYILDPDLLGQAMTLLALVLLPVIGFCSRKDVGARVLLGLGVGVPFLLFNPVVTPLLGRLITPWQLWKLLGLFPTGLILAYVVSLIAARTRGRLVGRSRASLVAGVTVLLVLPTMALGLPRYVQRPERFQHSDTLKIGEPYAKKLLLSLTDYGPPGSIVLAEKDLSQIIPAFHRDVEVLAPYDIYSYIRDDAPPTDPAVVRREDANRFYAGELDPDGIRSMLVAYGVTLVIVPKDSPARQQLDQLGPGVKLAEDFGGLLLYAVDKDRLSRQ